MKALATVLTAAAIALAGCAGGGEEAVRIPRGAGGVGFLPLYLMEKHGLVEKHAREAGAPDLQVRWIDLGGPSVMNDALLSGSVDFGAAGPPAFLTLWDRTSGTLGVKGVAAITSLPMYLNTRADHLNSLDDLRETDKIAVTAIRVSIPSIVMQMRAAERFGMSEASRYDRYTVSLTHPDGVVALLSGAAGITAHFTSPPFHQRERKDPGVRTIMTTNDVMGGSTTFTMLYTTSRFREENPLAYTAVLRALEEAHAMIVGDRRAAAELLLESMGGGGFTVDELVEVLEDPDITFTTTPENVKKYADFMNELGSIGKRPASWDELFFPEIHGAPGS